MFFFCFAECHATLFVLFVLWRPSPVEDIHRAWGRERERGKRRECRLPVAALMPATQMQEPANDEKIPITLLSGFLGALRSPGPLLRCGCVFGSGDALGTAALAH